MSGSSPAESHALTRRSFLRVALASLPAAALPGGPLAAVWPAAEREREVGAPYVLCMEEHCIWDPSEPVYWHVPTIRELLSRTYDPRFAHARGAALRSLLVRYVTEWEGVAEDEGAAAAAARVRRLHADLDEPADLGLWEHHHREWTEIEEGHASHRTMLLLSAAEVEPAGVYFVEGGHPGSNFTSVCFDGTVEELNGALARVGLNVVVEERRKCPSA